MSEKLETVLTISTLQFQTIQEQARQAGLARRPRGQPTETGKAMARPWQDQAGMQPADCRPNRREKSVRLTGRDKPCRQAARAAHPFPTLPSQPYHGPRGLRWIRRCNGSGVPLFFWGPSLFFSSCPGREDWRSSRQTLGCESLVNPVIKPKTQDPPLFSPGFFKVVLHLGYA